MLKVWYSNQLDTLAKTLVEVDRAERARLAQSPLERTPVVIPGDAMSDYLRFQIARQSGISARMAFVHIGNFFESALPRDADLSLISSQTLHYLVYRALSDDQFLASDALKHPREYLQAAQFDPDALQIRRFQLSGHIARLFDEYELNRPQMLQKWSAESAAEDAATALKHEAWQREIWTYIFGTRGLLSDYFHASGHRLLRLGELIDKVPGTSWEVAPVVHFFGPDRVGRAFEPLLAKLAEVCDVHIWALNPCQEFWEDVLTDIDEEAHLLSSQSTRLDGARLGGARLDDARPDDATQPGLFGPPAEEPFWQPERFPLPLRLWGRVGRDQMRMFNRLCAHDPQMLFAPTAEEQPTILRQIQRDILTLAYEREAPIPRLQDATGDASIQILACPGIQREVEVVANEIWRLLKDDPTLGLNQIAILLSREQASAYHTQIAAVFHDVYELPFHIRDIQKSAAGGVFEAVDLLLDLTYSELRRADFLRLLTHPNVMARYDNIAPETWVRWCEELQIVHGADHDAHRDTYITHDIFNWDQGLKRLVLGGFMTGADYSHDERIFEGDVFEYLPHEYSADDIEAATELVQLARDLMHDTARCRHEKMPLGDWFEWAGKLVAQYLAPNNSEDEDDLKLCRQTFAELARIDIFNRENDPDEEEHGSQISPKTTPKTTPATQLLDEAPTDPVSFRVAREFIRRAIDTLEGHLGQYLIDGVSISTLTPARPLPFRHIFMLGMGEANFPASEPVDPLDLRRQKWQEGDATRRDQDKYALLQALMAARERVYLSYIARDSSTGESLQPSSALQDLIRMLEQQYLGPESTRKLIQKHPLRRFDAAYFPIKNSTTHKTPTATKTNKQSELNNLSRENPKKHENSVEKPDILPIQPNFHPEARREAAARALRHSLNQHLEAHEKSSPHFIEMPDLPTLREQVNPQAARLVDEILGGYALAELDKRPALAAHADQAGDDILDLSISLTQLRQFLESPLQAGARFNLGMRADDQEDPFAVENEPFEPNYMESVGLLRDVFSRALSRDANLNELSELDAVNKLDEANELDAANELTHQNTSNSVPKSADVAQSDPITRIYDARTKFLELKGALPTGVFFENARAQHLAALKVWQQNLDQLYPHADQTLRPTHLGRAPGRAPADRVLDSISLETTIQFAPDTPAKPVRIEIYGTTELVDEDATTAVTAVTRARARDKDFLRGFLTHVALAAAGKSDDTREFSSLVLPTDAIDKPKSYPKFRRVFKAMTQTEARAYLTQLAHDYLSGPHPELMPIEAVFGYYDPKNDAPFGQIVEKLVSNPRRSHSAKYGPLRDPAHYQTPENAETIIARRFDPFFSRIIDETGKK